jgi:hypothetical protein
MLCYRTNLYESALGIAERRGKVKVGDAICIIDETKSREQAGI